MGLHFTLITALVTAAIPAAQRPAPVTLTIAQSAAALATETEPDADVPQTAGRALPDSEKFRVRLKFMAGWGHDDAQAELGFEKQGRVGYAIVEMFGALSERVRYRLALNPVDETQPKPACGQPDYFFPNSPDFLGATGPVVACTNDGNRRVDMYKYIALDWYNQQGPVREAFITMAPTRGLTVDFGRFNLQKGFDPEEVGSFTAKDSTRIQRINAETNFGIRFSWAGGSRAGGMPPWAVSAAGVLGDGNRNADYSYFYFERDDLDSNSALTALFTARVSPFARLDLRVAAQRGYSGSKVERLPHYFASKRNDQAIVASARYELIPGVVVFGEAARYVWGITATSAEMLGFDGEPVIKRGAYAGAEASRRVRGVRLGLSYTQEAISRDDSLVRYLVETGAPHVSLGELDRGRIARGFVEFAGIRIGYYRNFDETAFPWLSGIAPISGDRALQSRGTNKWGLAVRVVVE